MAVFWRAVYEDLIALNGNPKSMVYNIIFSGSFHLIFLHRVSAYFWLRNLRFVARRVADLIRIFYACDISPGAVLGQGCVFIHPFCVVVGDGAIIGPGCKIYNGVTVGNRKGHHADGMARIGENVILGTGAKILGPIIIGDRSKIGANSVVLSDVPSDATAVGIPAKVVF